MTINIIEPAHARQLGIAFRAIRSGPENELIDEFLKRRHFSLERGYRVTIFREPKLETGFPDIVMVVWDPSCTRWWPAEREQLTCDDLRIAQVLSRCGRATVDELKRFTGRNSGTSLHRLEKAELVSRNRNGWRLRPLTEIFAARQIISIEAKISKLNKAIQQAWLNTWFASDSFVLVPRHQTLKRGVNCTSEVNLWNWSEKYRCSIKNASKVARSYASWLFNEWVWRVSLR